MNTVFADLGQSMAKIECEFGVCYPILTIVSPSNTTEDGHYTPAESIEIGSISSLEHLRDAINNALEQIKSIRAS